MQLKTSIRLSRLAVDQLYTESPDAPPEASLKLVPVQHIHTQSKQHPKDRTDTERRPVKFNSYA
jgi:hypothetical protein